MRFAKTILVVLLVAPVYGAPHVAAAADQLIYSGPWVTTNRPLEGEMTCVVTAVGKEQWRGRFYGVWQGVDFDYTVDFSGPHLDLRGKGAHRRRCV